MEKLQIAAQHLYTTPIDRRQSPFSLSAGGGHRGNRGTGAEQLDIFLFTFFGRA